jgi:hypothetical protein
MQKLAENVAPAVVPLLAQHAVPRQNHPDIPGRYCASLQVWVANEVPLAMSGGSLPELQTKTSAQIESDDVSPTLLEMVTKTKTQVERDDQGIHLATS